MSSYDVYSYGVISSSTLYRIAGSFPKPEGYAEILDVHHSTGGEATNSSIVLSRLGANVKLDGNWLGDDESGKRTEALLAEYDIDTSRLPRRKGHQSVQEVIFAEEGTRTIFGTYGRLHEEEAWNMPHKEDISQAKVVSVDPFFAHPASRVAKVAWDNGIPLVTVDCKYDDPLLTRASAAVIAESFIRDNYPDRDLKSLFGAYQAATNGLTIFTFGAAPTWYGRPADSIKHHKPFTIDPVDTTGGGDSFRAGIVFGFLKGWEDLEMINFASAVAAMNCSRFPGVLNSPTYAEVADFLAAKHTQTFRSQ